jgi:hypothetical protein
MHSDERTGNEQSRDREGADDNASKSRYYLSNASEGADAMTKTRGKNRFLTGAALTEEMSRAPCQPPSFRMPELRLYPAQAFLRYNASTRED